jgi:TolB-like protein/Tfp pilus assembly protein PilF
MPDNKNKITRFWQELKQRKVIRMITVYAASAFVILELVDILSEPFGLPAWTMKLVVALLALGLIVASVLSWIYDISPGGELVKTDDQPTGQALSGSSESKGWKVATYVSLVLILGMVVFHFIYRNNSGTGAGIPDKSIAVLPFIDDSPDKNNEHIINGIMEDLLINLQSIRDLRVPGRTSVEQYRNNPKGIPDISREMNVAYILEGSGQRYGNKIRLRVQLVEGATDRNIWADSYDEVISGPEDIFRIQSQIARAIAGELEAVITPEETQILEKVPTSSLHAYDLFQLGRESLWEFFAVISGNEQALERARGFFVRAVEHDKDFAVAYAELANIYMEKFTASGHMEQSFLDSVKYYVDRALSIDDQLALAYSIRGNYHYIHTQMDKARADFNRALEINPNDYRIYLSLGRTRLFDDPAQSIYTLEKSTNLLSGTEKAIVLYNLAEVYSLVGLSEKAELYSEQALALNGDSLSYFLMLNDIDYQKFDHENGIRNLMQAYALDSTDNRVLLMLMWHHMYLEHYGEALKFCRKWIENRNQIAYFDYNNMHRIAFVLWQNGFKEEADYYFSLQEDYSLRLNELDQVRAQGRWPYYDLAGIYAFHGEGEKAYENLRIYSQKESEFWLCMIDLIKSDPLFVSLRDDAEFQQIVREVEVKCLDTHEQIKSWLEEHDLL